jgi:hypothetical protein
LLHWLSWVQVLGVLLLLDEDAPPAPPEDVPALPPEDFAPPPPPPLLLLDELLLPALLLPPAWLLLELLVELPPAPAFDELLFSPLDPPPELRELSEVPPEDLLLLPLLPPSSPLLALSFCLTAQVTKTKALARMKMGKCREGRLGQDIVFK